MGLDVVVGVGRRDGVDVSWSCPKPGDVLCESDAVRMPVGSVIERLPDAPSGKRYRVVKRPVAMGEPTAHEDGGGADL
jgi:hypothetical protein